MMRRFQHYAGWTSLAIVAALSAGGCATPQTQRMNAPPQGEGPGRPEWTDVYAHHNDQGMMADRSIADIHFIPGSADLSGTGIARLERYAELLATSGGVLRYDPMISDEELIKARLACAADFLKEAMPSDKGIRIETGMADGRGMSAAEAKSGQDVAKQAEPRGSAYSLTISKSGD